MKVSEEGSPDDKEEKKRKREGKVS